MTDNPLRWHRDVLDPDAILVEGFYANPIEFAEGPHDGERGVLVMVKGFPLGDQETEREVLMVFHRSGLRNVVNALGQMLDETAHLDLNEEASSSRWEEDT